ncbi:iron complex outermembrane recepter protein [Reichenbachiella faecimaris]|uniref:Iron complex outermembrane recepter protein n=1 Tax=Reichenbachiella faecimaris TaxID=692418 RepID=A0A1W2G5I2_REIFA|nr:TonB-dependent receptor [Reichenbachiella faecimaris]SMD31702.1 iron complex outermembrane recepter protein [Reichenbachiella faecimaris]
MKKYLFAVAMLCSTIAYAQKAIAPDSIKTVDLKEIVVSSTRATTKTPMTFNEIKQEEIEENNTGKDLPYLLEMTPSAVTTSDAGAGVGYTGIRIRGSDPARVNVTLNGIPYNDPESQQVFWVNLPDFASSVSSIQVQRGLGTSTNGAGAFGASVNIETKGLNRNSYATLDNSIGSFNTRKHTAMFGTGLIADKFAFDGRLSQITSDGYVDRATTDLKSYFLSGGYYGQKSLVKFNIFSGHETTYQAWYGVPESRMDHDVDEMNAYVARNFIGSADSLNLLNSGRTYNQYTYDNEIDDYDQTHYQLISAFDLSETITLNVSAFLIHGEGYFEQYKTDRDLADYGLNDITIGTETITSTDLIQRRWLNNNFYGTTFSLDYLPNNGFKFTLGGAWNQYNGDHFGKVIWAQYASNGTIRHPYYFNNSLKKDFNIFGKAIYNLSDQLSLFGDLQYRTVDYTMEGDDNDAQTIDQSHNYNFFNPKFGVKLQLNDQSSAYASVAIGSKEPVRNDFTDNVSTATPKAEKMTDLEIGYNRKTTKYTFNANLFWMDYKDQLVVTGELNDVGSSLRTNVDKSYRAGIELQLGYQLADKLKLNTNVSFSQNKIDGYNETIYNYGIGWDEYNADVISYGKTDIAFSPNVVAGGNLEYSPINGLNLRWIHKYVGEQFLDNTSTDSRKLDAYYVSDAIATYTLTGNSFKSISLKFAVYNLFNQMYSANGYTWGYRGGGEEIRENFYYPQAGTNFMIGLNIKL